MSRTRPPSDAELLQHAATLTQPNRSGVSTTPVAGAPVWRPRGHSVQPTELYSDDGAVHQGDLGRLQHASGVHLAITMRLVRWRDRTNWVLGALVMSVAMNFALGIATVLAILLAVR